MKPKTSYRLNYYALRRPFLGRKHSEKRAELAKKMREGRKR